MRIACLSGKGGAGKTLVAVNLAAVAGACTYIDCDVEEPNGHLFFKPEPVEVRGIATYFPTFDKEKCNGCRLCVQNCRFHALAYIKEKPMLFPTVCHSCGACQLVCPQGAVSEVPRPVGVVEVGQWGAVQVVTGRLNPGQASGIPVIHGALSYCGDSTILDGPPGSACAVMETVMAADYCILVAEPTTFGLHNIKMVHELVQLLGKPCGLVVNKETTPYPPLEAFCVDNHIPILARIPYDATIGALVADGAIMVEHLPEERGRFVSMLRQIGGGL